MRSPFDSRRPLTDRILGFAGGLLVLAIAVWLIVSLIERFWPLILGLVVLIVAGWIVIRLWRARSGPWQ